MDWSTYMIVYTHAHTHNGADFLWSHTCYVNLSHSLFPPSFCVCADWIEIGARTNRQTCEWSRFNLHHLQEEFYWAAWKKLNRFFSPFFFFLLVSSAVSESSLSITMQEWHEYLYTIKIPQGLLMWLFPYWGRCFILTNVVSIITSRPGSYYSGSQLFLMPVVNFFYEKVTNGTICAAFRVHNKY